MENALSYSARSDPTWIESRNWDQPDSENRYVYRLSLAIELDEARAAREDDAAGALEERGDEFLQRSKVLFPIKVGDSLRVPMGDVCCPSIFP